MPELPEVETVRRGLEKLLLGRTILSLEVKVPKMIKTSYDSFCMICLVRRFKPCDVGESISFLILVS